jgi:hypothetical protein
MLGKELTAHLGTFRILFHNSVLSISHLQSMLPLCADTQLRTATRDKQYMSMLSFLRQNPRRQFIVWSTLTLIKTMIVFLICV